MSIITRYESDFIDFLQTGWLGELDAQMSLQSLVSNLGMPALVGIPTEQYATPEAFWAYVEAFQGGVLVARWDDLRVWLRAGKIHSIHLPKHTQGLFHLPSRLEVPWLMFAFNLSQLSLRELVTRYDLPCYSLVEASWAELYGLDLFFPQGKVRLNLDMDVGDGRLVDIRILSETPENFLGRGDHYWR